MPPFAARKLLRGKMQEDFDKRGAYINTFGCVYPFPGLVGFGGYFRDETRRKSVMTSKEALCLNGKCLRISFSLPPQLPQLRNAVLIYKVRYLQL